METDWWLVGAILLGSLSICLTIIYFVGFALIDIEQLLEDIRDKDEADYVPLDYTPQGIKRLHREDHANHG